MDFCPFQHNSKITEFHWNSCLTQDSKPKWEKQDRHWDRQGNKKEKREDKHFHTCFFYPGIILTQDSFYDNNEQFYENVNKIYTESTSLDKQTH